VIGFKIFIHERVASSKIFADILSAEEEISARFKVIGKFDLVIIGQRIHRVISGDPDTDFEKLSIAV